MKLIEMLDKYGLKCTFNLNSELFTKDSGSVTLTEEETIEDGKTF